MIAEYIKAFGLIFLAEMGDKTQILALAFATRYKVRQVLWGIFFGVLLNHGLAVVLGNLMSSVIPMDWIQRIAGMAFLAFALWSLRVEDDDEAADKTSRSGPVVTVATAFFIGELGDKTQLSAITLASTADYPLLILAGTITGMLLVGLLGIIIGRQLGNRIPETALKLIAAGVFVFFGMQKLVAYLPTSFVQSVWLIPSFVIYGAVVIFLVLRLRSHDGSRLKAQARQLKEFYQSMGQNLEDICLHCQSCHGEGCHVGYSKLLVTRALDSQPSLKEFVEHVGSLDKAYPQSSIEQALEATKEMLIKYPHDVAIEKLKKQLLQMKEPEHLPVAQNRLQTETRHRDDQPADKA